MWWQIVLPIAFITAAVLAFKLIRHNQNKGDFKDGGGNLLGGHISLKGKSDEELADLRGEKLVNSNLRRLLHNDEYLLCNLLIPTNNDSNTEIDSIIISRKGIFVIEIKNWVGHISGNDVNQYWLQEYDDEDRNDKAIYSPVLQNQNHCKAVSKLLLNRFSINGYVVFTGFDDDDQIESKVTYDVKSFKKYYRSLNGDKLSKEEIKEIFQKLVKYLGSDNDINEYKEKLKNRIN